MQKVTIRVEDREKILPLPGHTLTGSCERIVAVFLPLYSDVVVRLEAAFSEEEKDIMEKGYAAIIENNELLSKVRELHAFDRACLEIMYIYR